MAGIVRPRNFPIRKPQDNQQDHGKIFNQKRYPDHGGFTSASALPDGGPFSVEAPVKGAGSADRSNRGTQE